MKAFEFAFNVSQNYHTEQSSLLLEPAAQKLSAQVLQCAR